MRRRAVVQRIEQEAELGAGFLLADAQQLEHRALHVRAVDADRTTADLVAIEDHVVAARDRGPGVRTQLGDVVHRRRGEGVMQGDETLGLLVPLEHREVGDPQRPPAIGHKTEVLARLQAHRTHEVADRVVATGAEEHDVAVAGADVGDQRGELVLGKELGDRRSDFAGLAELDVGQALAAVLGRVGGILIDLLARQQRAARNAQRGHAAFGLVGGGREHGKSAVLDQLGHIDQFQVDAQVRLVRTVAAHRLGPAYAREWRGQLHVDHFGEDRADHLLDEILHVTLAHEGKLHVQLGEFQLAVCAQGFVAEAARDLVVAVEAGHHQDLLEQLRALRQCVELTRMHARRHQEVARAFRRGLGQDRGLDVLEAARVQIPAQRLHQPDPGALHALHLRAAQIQIAVLQARFLARVLVRMERQRRGLVEHGDRAGDHLDLAGPEPVVDRMAGADHALDLQHVLIAQRGGDGEDLRVVQLHRHLHDALVVAQVDEADPALVTGHIGPAGQGDGLADQGLIDQAAEVGTHCNSRRAAKERPQSRLFCGRRRGAANARPFGANAAVARI